MGIAMIVAGGIFIFLSRYKNISDDEIQRVMSLNTADNKQRARQAAVNLAHNNKDVVKQAVIDNKDVIAQVAYEHRDEIAQVAYDNKEVLAQAYLDQQNN